MSPAEVENLLLRWDAISQVAVVGIPDDRLGEVGAAFVVPRSGVSLSDADVIAWAREHIANYKVPRRVELVTRTAAQRERQGAQGRVARSRWPRGAWGMIRGDRRIDVTASVGHGEPLEVSVTVVAPSPEQLPPRPFVVVAIPGGTYHRRYWDLHPPGAAASARPSSWPSEGSSSSPATTSAAATAPDPTTATSSGSRCRRMPPTACSSSVRDSLAQGTLVDGLPPVADPTIVGIGQSLGGFITMIQQGKYADYPAIGIFGASPLLIANTREQPEWEQLSAAERRAWITAENARQSGGRGIARCTTAHRESSTAASST